MGNDVTGGFLYETSYAEGNATHAEKNAEGMCGCIARPCFNVSQIGKDPSQFTIEQAKKLCEFLEIEFDVMFFNWNAVYFFIFDIYNK